MENEWNPYEAPRASLKPSNEVIDYRSYNVALVLSNRFLSILGATLFTILGAGIGFIALRIRPEPGEWAPFLALLGMGLVLTFCGIGLLWQAFRELRLAYRTRDRRIVVRARL
jgi:hypothetical protein